MAKKETKKTKQHGIFVSFLKALLAFVTPVVLPLAVGFALGAFKVGGDKQVLLFSLIFSAVGLIVGIILAKFILFKKNTKKKAVCKEAEEDEEDEEESQHEIVYYAEDEDDDDATTPSEVVYYSVEDEE